MQIRVAIIEDNSLMRDAMQIILNGNPGTICCGAWSDGHRWEQNLKSAKPDVLLLDIELPGKSGIELAGLVSQRFPEIKILMQTVFADADKIFMALCAGASGYLLKDELPSRYVEAVQEVYNGGAPISPAVARKMIGFFTSKNVILVSPEGSDYQLSDREKELLKLMVDGHNYRSIADLACISYETVRTHVKNIYRKLHVVSRSEAVMKALQQGLGGH